MQVSPPQGSESWRWRNEQRPMVAVAQLVRAPDCGSGGCGFNSRQSPLTVRGSIDRAIARSVSRRFRSVAQLVEHRSPKPAVGGLIPSGPAWTVAKMFDTAKV